MKFFVHSSRCPLTPFLAKEYNITVALASSNAFSKSIKHIIDLSLFIQFNTSVRHSVVPTFSL